MPVLHEKWELQIWSFLQVPSPKREEPRSYLHNWTPWASSKTSKLDSYFYFCITFYNINIFFAARVQVSDYRFLGSCYHGLTTKGQPVCTFYSTHGSCKYGATCKFDHPFMGYYSYTLPAFSVLDPPVLFPSRRNSPAVWMLAEDSNSKTVRLPDQHVKYETSDEAQDSNDYNLGSPTQASPSHFAAHSESPEKYSD